MTTTPQLLALNVELYLKDPEVQLQAEQAVGDVLATLPDSVADFSERQRRAADAFSDLYMIRHYPEEFDDEAKIEIIRKGLQFRKREPNRWRSEAFRRFCRQHDLLINALVEEDSAN